MLYARPDDMTRDDVITSARHYAARTIVGDTDQTIRDLAIETARRLQKVPNGTDAHAYWMTIGRTLIRHHRAKNAS